MNKTKKTNKKKESSKLTKKEKTKLLNFVDEVVTKQKGIVIVCDGDRLVSSVQNQHTIEVLRDVMRFLDKLGVPMDLVHSAASAYQMTYLSK